MLNIPIITLRRSSISGIITSSYNPSCISINLKSIINNCNFECDISNWEVKGEGRKKFIFSEQSLKQNEKAGFELDLTDSGGSLFLRDEEGRLVLWEDIQ